VYFIVLPAVPPSTQPRLYLPSWFLRFEFSPPPRRGRPGCFKKRVRVSVDFHWWVDGTNVGHSHERTVRSSSRGSRRLEHRPAMRVRRRYRLRPSPTADSNEVRRGNGRGSYLHPVLHHRLWCSPNVATCELLCFATDSLAADPWLSFFSILPSFFLSPQLNPHLWLWDCDKMAELSGTGGGAAAQGGEPGPAVETREYRSGPMYKLTVGLIGTYKHINEVRQRDVPVHFPVTCPPPVFLCLFLSLSLSLSLSLAFGVYGRTMDGSSRCSATLVVA
jgi:hypothetical protein